MTGNIAANAAGDRNQDRWANPWYNPRTDAMAETERGIRATGKPEGETRTTIVVGTRRVTMTTDEWIVRMANCHPNTRSKQRLWEKITQIIVA